MSRKRSVILLSGGLDSAANLALCRERDEPILALTVDYGQRAAIAELRAARALCEVFGVRHQAVELKWLGGLGGSGLTDPARKVPELSLDELDQAEVTRESAKAVWVPNRNGVLLQVAAAFAEREGAHQVVVGFNIEEAATFPDNTIEFMLRTTAALELSTANHVQVTSYTAELNKTEIVRSLRKMPLKFPFEKIWSCYQGGESACGVCESCQRFKRAFAG